MFDMRKLWNNVVDFRKKIISALHIRPADSKENDFNLALAEYLYKELKNENLDVSKRDGLVKVKLANLYKERYNHLIIDCHVGKMYLRGENVSDSYFGRLRRFEGSRAADAYHCVAQSATRIINRIKKITNSVENNTNTIEVLGETTENISTANVSKENLNIICVDMRARNKVMDRRKVANHGLLNRTEAITIINGEVFQEGTHPYMIEKYLSNHKEKGKKLIEEFYVNDEEEKVEVLNAFEEHGFLPHEILKQLSEFGRNQFNFSYIDMPIGFAHLCNDSDEKEIFLETKSLKGMTIDEATALLKAKYPDYDVYDDDSYSEFSSDTEDYKKIARKDMRKRNTIIAIKDHRRILSWLHNGKVVASGYDDRTIKIIERIDYRKNKNI